MAPGRHGGPPSHRAFAAFWDWASTHESQAERRLRQRVAAKAAGRVLEVGVGVGSNWPHLPAGIDYIGIEPDPHMLKRARKRATGSKRAVVLEQARAEALPFPDASFDTVLVTLTFCSVQDPRRALAEVHRVLKPGGSLLFFEHVRPTGRIRGWFFDRITPFWRRIGGGCHPNRRTLETIASAGLAVESLERQRLNGLPMVTGVARRPGGRSRDEAHGPEEPAHA